MIEKRRHRFSGVFFTVGWSTRLREHRALGQGLRSRPGRWLGCGAPSYADSLACTSSSIASTRASSWPMSTMVAAV